MGVSKSKIPGTTIIRLHGPTDLIREQYISCLNNIPGYVYSTFGIRSSRNTILKTTMFYQDDFKHCSNIEITISPRLTSNFIRRVFVYVGSDRLIETYRECLFDPIMFLFHNFYVEVNLVEYIREINLKLTINGYKLIIDYALRMNLL